MHKWNVASATCGFIAFLLLMYGVSTTYWSRWDLIDTNWNYQVVYRAGLWKRGYDATNMQTVDTYCPSRAMRGVLCRSVEAVRTLVISSIGLSFVGGILACFAEHADGKIDQKTPAGMFFLGGAMTLIGWIVWVTTVETDTLAEIAVNYEGTDKTIGYSQVLIILSWLLQLLAGVCAMLIPAEVIGKIVPH